MEKLCGQLPERRRFYHGGIQYDERMGTWKQGIQHFGTSTHFHFRCKMGIPSYSRRQTTQYHRSILLASIHRFPNPVALHPCLAFHGASPLGWCVWLELWHYLYTFCMGFAPIVRSVLVVHFETNHSQFLLLHPTHYWDFSHISAIRLTNSLFGNGWKGFFIEKRIKSFCQSK